jgi:hypothetical protein
MKSKSEEVDETWETEEKETNFALNKAVEEETCDCMYLCECVCVCLCVYVRMYVCTYGVYVN